MTERTRTNGQHERGRYVFVYNMGQAQFFLDHGLRPVAIGRGTRGDVFLKFERNEATEAVFENWLRLVER